LDNKPQRTNRNLHLTATKPGEYEGVCLNPKDIPPDDLDDVILGKMIKEPGMLYKMEDER